MKIPGIGDRAAQVVISEIGVDMARFPSAAHLASWAGLCPGNHESAGKHRSGKRRLIRELEALGHKVTIEPAAA
jgi:transposase